MESLNARPRRHKEPCATTFLTSWPQCRSIKRRTKQRSRKLAATVVVSFGQISVADVKSIFAAPRHPRTRKGKVGPKCWNCGGGPRMDHHQGWREGVVGLRDARHSLYCRTISGLVEPEDHGQTELTRY